MNHIRKEEMFTNSDINTFKDLRSLMPWAMSSYVYKGKYNYMYNLLVSLLQKHHGRQVEQWLYCQCLTSKP